MWDLYRPVVYGELKQLHPVLNGRHRSHYRLMSGAKLEKYAEARWEKFKKFVKNDLELAGRKDMLKKHFYDSDMESLGSEELREEFIK